MLARIVDEGICRKSEHHTPISYQAYSINYEQVTEFIGFLSEIEKIQKENTVLNNAILRTYQKPGETEDETLKKSHICGFSPFPKSTRNGKIAFMYKRLSESPAPLLSKKWEPILSSTQYLKLGIHNTCRTTSLNIIETLLEFRTTISKYFFISPKYQTTLEAGEPCKDSFYVLPTPPIVKKKLVLFRIDYG